MNRGESMADNFGEDWEKALNNIEISPDPVVWDRVNHSLAEGELVYYKKKASRYKWAAVAAVFIAVSVSVPQFLLNTENSNQIEATSTLGAAAQNSLVEQPLAVNVVSGGNTTPTAGESLQIPVTDIQNENNGGQGSIGNFMANNDDDFANLSASFLPITIESKDELPFLIDTKTSVPEITIYKKADYSLMLAKESSATQPDKRFWAGLGVGSSSFDPNYQLNQPNEVVSAVMRSEPNFVNSDPGALSQEASYSDRITEGVNYQFGVNMGVMLGNRLSLESGFNYAEAQLASHTNLIVENKIFARSVAVTSEMVSVQQVSQVTNTQDIIEYQRTDISLDNTFQFASIPLKAGYQIVDKKIQVKLNAGFITNVYMGNTLTDDSDQVASLQLFPGDNSPYRTVSFSGITGISIGYNLFNSLDLTLEPNFSQALQPLTKAESNFNATPNGFGMIAGLRYRFGN